MLRLLTSSGGIYLLFFAVMVAGWVFSKFKSHEPQPVETLPTSDELLNNSNSLVEAIQNQNWRVRLAAAQTLAQSADLSKLPELLQLSRDSDNDVRETVAGALVQLGAPVVPFMRESLHHSELRCRETALQVLQQINSEEARDGLIEALKDESFWIRLPAAQALANRDDPIALEAIRTVLSDPDERVQEVARQALEND